MKETTSSAQQAANRANAEKSTGPKTEEGKRISSHNALKTGLTGRTVLLPTDDVAAYQGHLVRIEERYEPKTDEERQHVENIAQLEWRLLRIPSLETNLLALGRKRFAGSHTDEPEATRAGFIEAEVLLAFAKPLANLALQETRLNRQHDRELARLEALQTARRKREAEHLEEAARLYMHCQQNKEKFFFNDLAEFGFEFSFADIQRRVAQHAAKKDATAWPTIQAHYRFHEMQPAA